MKFIISILLFHLAFGAFENSSPTLTAALNRDSMFIKGRVVDQNGKPMTNVLLLFQPFYKEKFDVIIPETDTNFTNKNGDFIVAANSGQLYMQTLYFKKEDFLISKHYFPEIAMNMIIDTPIVLYSRKENWFNSREIDSADIGITIASAIQKFKINFSYSKLFTLPNSPTTVLGLRCEMPDSSMVLFTVESYNAAALKRQAILEKKIIGIGVAFPNGEKKTIGNFLYDDRKIYNEHYLEQQELMEVFSQVVRCSAYECQPIGITGYTLKSLFRE